MNHIPLTSSLLASYAYDPDTRILELVFQRGGRYRYAGVSPEQAQAFAAAESKGKHFLAEIKPHFACTKCGPEAG